MTYKIETIADIDRLREMLTEEAHSKWASLDRKLDQARTQARHDAEDEAEMYIPETATDVEIIGRPCDGTVRVHYTLPIDRMAMDALTILESQADAADKAHDEVSDSMSMWAARAARQLLTGETVEMPPWV